MKYSKTFLIGLSLICMILFSCNESSIGNAVTDISEFNKAVISRYGPQAKDNKDNIFKNSKAINMHLVVGEPIAKMRNNTLRNSGSLEVIGDQKYSVENQWKLVSKFSDDESYSLSTISALWGKGKV